MFVQLLRQPHGEKDQESQWEASMWRDMFSRFAGFWEGIWALVLDVCEEAILQGPATHNRKPAKGSCRSVANNLILNHRFMLLDYK